MKALVLDAERRTASVQDVAKPTPGPDEILVQVHAVALNPVDALYVSHLLGASGRVVGSDFAGTVVSLGRAVPADCSLQTGSRVAGFLQGACSVNERPGAFAEFLVCPWDLVFAVPEGMSFEQAATISLCGLTAAQALYYRLGMRTPFPHQAAGSSADHADRDDGATSSVLIYGASTSVAMYAAQLVHCSAEASGTKINLLGTASERRFQMLRSPPYHYDDLVDYRDSEWPRRLSASSSDGGVQYAFDCIAEGETVKKVAHTLDEGGKMAIVRSREGGAWNGDGLLIEPSYGAVWEGLGEDVQYAGMRVPKSVEARAFAVESYRWLSKGAKLEPNPVRAMPGGLERIVPDGFALLGSDSMGDRGSKEDEKVREEPWMKPVSAEKLVYTIQTS